MMKRELWIDLLRGCCMTAIVYDHTESWFVDYHIIPYSLYVSNVLVIFYFISGYLFYRPTDFQPVHKLKSILHSIIIPYFFFMIALSLPKSLLHGNDFQLGALLTNVLTGQQSWFVTALSVAEVLLTAILSIRSLRLSWLLMFLAASTILSFLWGTGFLTTPYNFWHADEAIVVLPFLLLGYLVHRYDLFKKVTPPLLVLLAVIFFAVKTIIYTHHYEEIISPINISHYPLFLVDSLTSIFLICPLAKKIPRISFIEWTGRHSLVYYFFCSGIPLVMAILLRKIGFYFNGEYWKVPIAFLLNFMAITLLTWLCYRFLPPVLTGKRR
ncbi:MAG: acyltransferase family protein [Prevotella sp.]|nr:acyltransferase family protein [Prevotella sp.]